MFKDVSFLGGFYLIMSCLENLEFGFVNVFVLDKFSGYVRLMCKELIGGKTRVVDVYDSDVLLPITNL